MIAIGGDNVGCVLLFPRHHIGRKEGRKEHSIFKFVRLRLSLHDEPLVGLGLLHVNTASIVKIRYTKHHIGNGESCNMIGCGWSSFLPP